ncbi:MAG TPA: hypothetical protein VJ954_07495 [Ignavibacteriaceae bacterium]|nr:hypothetical protein [Ignavibacteriaceae bacterium]
MKKHSGMRPHDIAILLKISTFRDANWYAKDLALHIKISASEVSESLERSVIAGLISNDKKTLMKSALLEFLEFGLRYVYPVIPGSITRGVLTAHSAPPLVNFIQGNEPYVWPYANGNARGQSIEPLHPKLPEACLNDKDLYELLALTDALRIGRIREKQIAVEELKKRILI